MGMGINIIFLNRSEFSVALGVCLGMYTLSSLVELQISEKSVFCQRCVMPASYPGISFDDEGICQLCREFGDVSKAEDLRTMLAGKIALAISEALRQETPYQCIVAYSGGKDSTYTLMSLVREHNLRCLAVTVDNGFLSDTTFENCRVVCDSLEVDHVTFRPNFGFMRRMYTQSLLSDVHAPAAIKRASGICNSCINLINNHIIKVAFQNDVRLIAGGYLGGQVPKDSAVMNLNLSVLDRTRSVTIKRYVEHFGADAERYFSLPNAEFEVNPSITVINPMLALKYSEDEIIAEIMKLGWKRPNDTGGFSTNCRLNDVGILSHINRYGFHPYVAELAELVRMGYMSREIALRKISLQPSDDEVELILKKLGIDRHDLD